MADSEGERAAERDTRALPLPLPVADTATLADAAGVEDGDALMSAVGAPLRDGRGVPDSALLTEGEPDAD